MINIRPGIVIRDDELQFKYIRASGPGGQNINKVSTSVQLRFNVMQSSLPATLKTRVQMISGKRINSKGELIIESGNHRTQERNRLDAIGRLRGLLRRSLEVQRVRKPTRPTQASKERRLAGKKRISELKKNRQMKSNE